MNILFMELFSTAAGILFVSAGKPLRESDGGMRDEGIGGRRAWLGKVVLRISLLARLPPVPRDDVIPVLLSPLFPSISGMMLVRLKLESDDER